MNANEKTKRAEFAAEIAKRIRECKTQREAIKIAAAVVHQLHSPASINRAMDQFGDALCEIWDEKSDEQAAKP